MLDFKNVSFSYKDGTNIFQNISFKLPDRGIVFLKGPSGSGKTTLLNIIANLEKITSGKIYYNGNDVTKIKNYQSNVSFIPTENTLISFLNVKDNILFSSDLRINENVLTSLNINESLSKKITELSGGEAKRVDIIKTIFNSKSIILLDEPFNFLDKENNYKILDIIKNVSKTKLVIITSHKEIIIENIADITLTIMNQKIKCDIKNINVYKKQLQNNELTKSKKKDNLFIIKLLSSYKKSLSYFIILFICFSIFQFLININITKESLNAKLLIKNQINTTYIFNKLDDNNLVKVYSDDNFNLNISENKKNPLYYRKFENNLYLAGIKNFKYQNDLNGRLPQNDNEIVISQYLEEILRYYQIIQDDNIINQEIIFDNIPFKIVGVYNQQLGKFQNLKNILSNSQNSEINDLEIMFYNGIVSKNIIYFNDNYIDSLNNKKYEFSIFYSENYFKMKNTIKKYQTEDIFSSQIDNYSNTFNLIRNITYPLIIVLLIILVFINIYIIKNIYEEFLTDFNKLKYYNYRKKDIVNILFKIISFIIFISYLFSAVLDNIIIILLNNYLVISNNLLINIFSFNYLSILIILIAFLIMNRLYILIYCFNKK